MVFTTLSSTGRRIFSRLSNVFETVLIDEAAQASEIAALQALTFGCKWYAYHTPDVLSKLLLRVTSGVISKLHMKSSMLFITSPERFFGVLYIVKQGIQSSELVLYSSLPSRLFTAMPVLVGHPQQLPATALSQPARKLPCNANYRQIAVRVLCFYFHRKLIRMSS